MKDEKKWPVIWKGQDTDGTAQFNTLVVKDDCHFCDSSTVSTLLLSSSLAFFPRVVLNVFDYSQPLFMLLWKMWTRVDEKIKWTASCAAVVTVLLPTTIKKRNGQNLRGAAVALKILSKHRFQLGHP